MQTQTKVVQQLVARALTDADFRRELRQNPNETLAEMNLSQELRDAIVKAVQENPGSAESIVTRLSAQFGINGG